MNSSRLITLPPQPLDCARRAPPVGQVAVSVVSGFIVVAIAVIGREWIGQALVSGEVSQNAWVVFQRCFQPSLGGFPGPTPPEFK